MLSLLLTSMLTLAFNIQPAKADLRTWIVDDYGPADFSTIQEAINAASSGDTIIVKAGTYTENVDVNKDHLTIKSESGAEITIVQAANSSDHVFEITADYVNIRGFTVKGATGSWGAGICLAGKDSYYEDYIGHCSISNNIALKNHRGIILSYAFSNLVDNNIGDIYLGDSWSNTISNNSGSIRLDFCYNNILVNNVGSDVYIGIFLAVSYDNIVVKNTISKNLYGIYFLWDFSGNIFYLNNFVDNIEDVYYEKPLESFIIWWNSPSEIEYSYYGNTYQNCIGNYWSNYSGSDANGDGIGDTPYAIDLQEDYYPLMTPSENYDLVPDTTPPEAVIDLRISEITRTSAILTWTAPGDDGNYGTACYYDIRYSESEITDENWDLATQCISEVIPQPASSKEIFKVTGLSSLSKYYFAIKTVDETLNWSSLSNTIMGITPQSPPPGENLPPDQPINVLPRDGATNIDLTPTLLTSAFSDPNNDYHSGSQWQITTSLGDYSNPIFDSGEDTFNLTCITIPSGILSYSTTYYWRVRHKDNQGTWSAYSSETSFTTQSARAVLEEWTFAIITDLHIGRGYPDYSGEDYYLTERLEKVVEWINENHNDPEYNIKFVAVLGDIANSAKLSELQKAKEVLDNLEIPYIPVIGNHDVWSDGEADGDSYFNEIFNDDFFNQQCGKLGVAWSNGRTVEKLKKAGDSYLQNYAFTYKGINFVSLDFVNREAIIPTSRAKPVLHSSTMQWLDKSLCEGKPTILLSHHPMIENKLLQLFFGADLWKYIEVFSTVFDDITPIGKIINEAEVKFGTKVLANFAGHVHGWSTKYMEQRVSIFMDANVDYKEKGFFTPAGIPVVTTEALMVASNEPTPKGVIRIVTMAGNEVRDYSLVEGEFRGLNPSFEYDVGLLRVRETLVEFEAYAFTKRFTGEYPLTYMMAFGDGRVSEPKSATGEEVQFKHLYDEGGYYDVTLLVKGWTPDGKEKITETITLKIYVDPPVDLSIFSLSPVDIAVTDPDGLTISKQLNEIQGATYIEIDINGDNNPDDIILIPDRKIGDYLVTVIPETEVAPTDTYTLLVWPETEDEPSVLAENVQISNVPIKPYIVRSTETDVIPIIPATADFNPDTLNLKSKGEWVTVYIELPLGHGYDVSMINLTSVTLDGQVYAEAKPFEIGDYDSDGIPDLMVKFNRTAVKNILEVGGKVEIIVAGKLIDGRVFEGKDAIKVILPP